MPRVSHCLWILAALAAFPTLGSAQPPAKPADNTAVLTEAVRVLAAHQLHQTYQNIVFLSESRVFGPYTASELATRLYIAGGSLEPVEKQLERIGGLKGLTPTDVAELARLRKLVGHIRDQGKHLQAHWDSGVEEHATKYETAQKAAWKELADLLDLEPKKGTAPPPREPKKKP